MTFIFFTQIYFCIPAISQLNVSNRFLSTKSIFEFVFSWYEFTKVVLQSKSCCEMFVSKLSCIQTILSFDYNTIIYLLPNIFFSFINFTIPKKNIQLLEYPLKAHINAQEFRSKNNFKKITLKIKFLRIVFYFLNICELCFF